MLLIYGLYRFAQKRVGYRTDFCLTCKEERLAEQWRSFNCGHIFWVPILPFGFFKRWMCPTCKNNPHYIAFGKQSSREVLTGVFGVLTLILLLGVIVNSFHAPEPSQRESYAEGLKLMGKTLLVFASIFALSLTWTLRYRDPILAEKLPQLLPTPSDVCPFCKGNLHSSSFCDTCQLTRYDVPELRK